MKKNYFFLIGLLTIGLLSCKQSIYLNIIEPPAVYLTPNYNAVSIVNRSVNAAGKSKIVEMIESTVTLEGKLDKKAAEASIKGLFDRLQNNPQFNMVTILDSLTVENGTVNIFPAPMPWNQVQMLCGLNGSQLLFSLEVFDTDTRVNYSTQRVNSNTPLGNVPLLTHIASVVTTIKTGWRIYDPDQMVILDEFNLTNQVVNTGRGLNPISAVAAVLNREQSVLSLSSNIGQLYAERILEQQVSVWREYFRSGSRSMRMARRNAMVNDWQGASALWTKVMTNERRRKVVGRATFNMALYHEVNGNLVLALEMAQKAYGDYNIRAAREYVVLLERRLNNQQFIK